ncbi:MAG: hypothetical protein WCL32_21130 [Planctomycetota bacterium]
MHLSPLLQFIQRWWKHDRIRTSPSDGAILRLPLASIIRIQNIAYEIVARRVDSLAPQPAIVYDCVSIGPTCQLRIDCASPTKITLIDANGVTSLIVDDLELFPARG